MTTHLDAFLECLAQQRRFSPRSIEAYGYATGAYLGYLRERCLKTVSEVHRNLLLCDQNISGIPLPKLRPKLPEPLSHEEIFRLLEIPKGSRFVHVRNKVILEILYATGLRISELVGLRCSQVDLESRRVAKVDSVVITPPRPLPTGPAGARRSKAPRSLLLPAHTFVP